jgi:solute carrier family 25 citrate transporter 1
MTASGTPVRKVEPLPGSICALIGGLSGTIEVCINQPTVSWKNALQQGQKISFNPAIMYRGTFVNAVSIAPITAIQFGVAGLLTERILKSRSLMTKAASTSATSNQPKLTNSEKILTSLSGGAVSAVIVCPADMIIIQQQKSGLSLGNQIKEIATSYGYSKFSKGLITAIGRESLFVACYLGLAGILRNTLVSMKPDWFASKPVPTSPSAEPEGNVASLLVASMGAGIFAGYLTHPIDTIKTRLQSELSNTTKYTNIRQTASLLWAENGIKSFYVGVLPRTGRICAAVLIFNQCNHLFTGMFRKLGY